ncbi:hypothetical protein C5167_007109 [Papaver somniferum]|uniref:F-box domain-containing protein n=1 Tax=Papaver somniferum TaxID=3469 RepID=A0A4Y7JIB2_PAPSO|nr:hypothetical protein C5167_007109 [Papaver somniferum]
MGRANFSSGVVIQKKKSGHIKNLPYEILLDILSRLPVESVLECKLVCKGLLKLLHGDNPHGLLFYGGLYNDKINTDHLYEYKKTLKKEVVFLALPEGLDTFLLLMNTSYGIIGDIRQNHLLQILTLFAMETPLSLDAEDIRNEKSHTKGRISYSGYPAAYNV